MLHITQTIENKLYSYDPTEFMPIYRDGEVENRAEFVAYKIGKLVTPIHDKILTSAKHVGTYIGEAFEQSTLRPNVGD